jgi:uncharacterized membrane protein
MTLDIKFGKYIEDAFKIWKENLGLMAGMGAVMVLLGSLCFILMLIFAPAAFVMALALVDGKQPKPVIGDLFKGTQWLKQMLILFGLGIGVGLLCLIFAWIPIIGSLGVMVVSYGLGTACFFVVPFIVDRNLETIPAIKASWALVKPNFFPILGLYLIASLIGSIGFAACCIGIIVTIPLTWLITASAYRDLMAQSATAPVDVTPPPAG